MSENDYITELKARWPQTSDASLETIALADEALRAFPQSPRLWCIRGDLIQLGPKSSPHNLDDALACYQRAIEIAPQFVEAWESIGHFHKAVLDDEATAQRFFSEAKKLKGHPCGLTRVRSGRVTHFSHVGRFVLQVPHVFRPLVATVAEPALAR